MHPAHSRHHERTFQAPRVRVPGGTVPDGLTTRSPLASVRGAPS